MRRLLDFKIQTPIFGVKNLLKTKVCKLRMLSWMISLRSINLWISSPLPLKLPVKKITKKFLLAQKNRLQISGFLGVIFTYDFILYSKIAKNTLFDFKIQKTTQLLSLAPAIFKNLSESNKIFIAGQISWTLIFRHFSLFQTFLWFLDFVNVELVTNVTTPSGWHCKLVVTQTK